ncbi:hypothetical protein [Pseudactinotalea sp. Z1748]|uniref:hypothetical protein n=1 Tax=Pseudactinotalea sp. Z1748 TaxID=3413027 RepID=UPI003C7D2F3B
MDASTPIPEELSPAEPSPEELANADQVSDLPPSDTTASPEEDGEPEPDDTGEADPDVGATGTIRQLPAEDTLEDTGGRDLVDEGFNAPDAPGPLYEQTVADEMSPDGIDERVEIEEPEVWETPASDDEADPAL